MEKIVKKTFALAFGLLTSLAAHATTDLDRTVASIGVQGQTAYVSLSPAPSAACLYGLVYITDISTASGKALYATLLTSYTMGKSLGRIDYSQNVSGAPATQCVISLIQL